jgi:hypothetical protein
LACFESARCEAALRGSFFSAFSRADDRFREGFAAEPECEYSISR